MPTNRLLISVCGLFCLAGCNRTVNLVPDRASDAPDYMCTWNLQGYVVNYENSDLTREVMTEEYIFGRGKYRNWIGFYDRIREDLYFVMDDSWDIPADCNSKNDNPYLGRVELDTTRFPSFTGTPAERLRGLNDKVRAAGWKGVGGWICAQKSALYADVDEQTYWTERLKAADEAGVGYWKVDWGNEARNREWRRMLTRLGREYAPNLWIEHAMENEYVEFSDVFRTYDVENIIAQPVTIDRVSRLLTFRACEGAKGIVNCEDEPYIAVGLGCAIGIMRHPMDGNLPCGRQDEAFPPVGHNYKRCLDEVVRAVRWHRIAEPFAVDADCRIDTTRLVDSWELGENETWNRGRRVGSVLRESAPARISRRMELPVVDDTTSQRPYVLASRYPNGAVAVAAIGRALGREYVEKPVAVTVSVPDAGAPVGLFGHFERVTLDYPSPLGDSSRIYAQDLAGDRAVDITDRVEVTGTQLVVSGEVIREVGLMAATEGDLSAPGLVIAVK